MLHGMGRRAALIAAIALAAGVFSSGPALAQALREPTPAQTEGPYFKPGSPERGSLREAGMAGERIRIAGRVLDRAGRPIPGARLDFWQADAAGRYDNAGFMLRGHQFADPEGRYALETILPAFYGGRARHIHVKVSAPGGPVLTSQLYISGDPGNAGDRLVDARLLVTLRAGPFGKEGAFDFVLDAR